jgi:hypothetical protein
VARRSASAPYQGVARSQPSAAVASAVRCAGGMSRIAPLSSSPATAWGSAPGGTASVTPKWAQ